MSFYASLFPKAGRSHDHDEDGKREDCMAVVLVDLRKSISGGLQRRILMGGCHQIVVGGSKRIQIAKM